MILGQVSITRIYANCEYFLSSQLNSKLSEMAVSTLDGNTYKIQHYPATYRIHTV